MEIFIALLFPLLGFAVLVGLILMVRSALHRYLGLREREIVPKEREQDLKEKELHLKYTQS